MPDPAYIHGSSDLREVVRLERQAAFFAPLIFRTFDAAPGMRVLDLGTGVGAMAGELLRHFPGIHLTGVDLRPEQLAHARERHPIGEYVQGDATKLPFPDATFDRVHASWLLEHVPDPLAVLQETLRVLKPGGRCHFTEVDNASLKMTPPLPEVLACFAELNRAQLESGGDPRIGLRLPDLFARAHFSAVEAIPLRLVGNAGEPHFFSEFVEEFAGILESLDEALGKEHEGRILHAAAAVRGLLQEKDSELRYTAVVGRATRPEPRFTSR